MATTTTTLLVVAGFIQLANDEVKKRRQRSIQKSASLIQNQLPSPCSYRVSVDFRDAEFIQLTDGQDNNHKDNNNRDDKWAVSDAIDGQFNLVICADGEKLARDPFAIKFLGLLFYLDPSPLIFFLGGGK